jgi:hypothetical protein
VILDGDMLSFRVLKRDFGEIDSTCVVGHDRNRLIIAKLDILKIDIYP